MRQSRGAAILAVALLAAWELGAIADLVPTEFVSSPSRIVTALVELAASGELARHLIVTFARMLVALVWGGGAGLAMGLALGLSSRLRALFDPFIAALHPIPRMALLPIVLMLFGLGFLSKAFVVAIAVFFPMVINTTAGVREIDTNYLDAAQLFGASRRQTLLKVVLPAAMPTILIGARLAMTRVLGATVGLELITADDGLGAMLFVAWQTYRSEDLFATVVIIGILGVAFRAVVVGLRRLLVPWQPS